MYKEMAKKIVVNNLKTEESPQCWAEMFDICHGDDELLLAHCKALKKIFTNAVEEMEEEKKK